MQLKKPMLVLFAMALMFVMPHAIADSHEKNDRLAQVYLITAKEGHSKDLEEAITKYHHYMADKEGAWRYSWFSIMTGPNAGKYIAHSGGHNWADFDAEFDWEEEAGEKFVSDVMPYIDDMMPWISQTDDEVGIWPESMEGYKYISVTEWHIMPGKGREFNEGLKKVDAILKEGDWPSYYSFSYAVSGGHGSSVTLVSPRKSFADMAPKEPAFMDILNKAMGEEEAQAFMSGWGKTFKSGQNQLLKWEPKLSDYGDKK
jgi:hypothetical protein